MRYTRLASYLAIAMASASTLTACKDSPTSPGGRTDTVAYVWAATYATAEKFGGTTGTWRLKADLQITSDRRVLLGNTEIVNPTVGETTVTWSMADGNGTNASIQMLIESSSSYFWGDVGVAGKLFQGWIQYPQQGKLDYRGLAR